MSIPKSPRRRTPCSGCRAPATTRSPRTSRGSAANSRGSGDRPLARFLREDLPRAALDDNERALLCLP
jgi:hypothetical protein